MKIISAQFDNYRSFGAPVYFEFTRNIVGLIGQNGMGKTNALEALSRMRFFTDEVLNVISGSAINQNTEEVSEIVLHAELDDRDVAELGPAMLGSGGDRKVSYRFRYETLYKRTRMSFTGFYFNCIQNNPTLFELHEGLAGLLSYLSTPDRQMRAQEFQDLRESIDGVLHNRRQLVVRAVDWINGLVGDRPRLVDGGEGCAKTHNRRIGERTRNRRNGARARNKRSRPKTGDCRAGARARNLETEGRASRR